MREADCRTWLADRFPGTFSAEKQSDRPALRLLMTKQSVPFNDRGGWLAPVGLASGPMYGGQRTRQGGSSSSVTGLAIGASLLQAQRADPTWPESTGLA